MRRRLADQAAVTSYPVPTPAWEPWYSGYRFGAFYLFPPRPVADRIDALRARFDPRAHAICAAHVSLTVPLPGPLTGRDAEEVRAALGGTPRFEVFWGPPMAYPGVAGVVLQVGPAPVVAALVARLERCRCFRGASGRDHPFSPHMTVAEFIDLRRTEEILSELQAGDWNGTWTCTEVVYAVPDQDFRFTARMTGQLAGTG